jgi:hypothetical protein
MSGLPFYSNYLNNIIRTPNEDWREEQQEFINEMFDNTTVECHDIYEEGYPFDFKFIDSPSCWIGTIVDVTTGLIKDSDDYRTLYFQDISHVSERGKYFKWNNNYWIVYETTNELETISRCNIRRCNNWLRWVTDKGELMQYPCVIEGELTSANAQVAKLITQANSHINIIVQGNVDTRAIKKNARFCFNGSVYKFYAINNYMQQDMIDENTPMLFMDFYLDMAIDDDNLVENIADDNRQDYHVECSISELCGHIGDIGTLVTTAYKNDKQINSPRLEFLSSDENIISIDNDGNYVLHHNGQAEVIIQIHGNELSQTVIPITVDDSIVTTYQIIVNPSISHLNQGLSTLITAKIVDNLNHDIIDNIVLTPSGADSVNNYTITDNGNNSWVLTNNLKSKKPLILTFSNDTYNIVSSIVVQLRAMF